MPDGQVARETLQDAFAEDIGNEPHLLMNDNLLAVTGNNPRAFLASVLQGVQTKIGEFSGVWMTEDAADTAFMPGFYR